MIKHTGTVSLLNDLVEINYNRVKGYELAAAELTQADADLQAIFRSMANDSKKYAHELKEAVTAFGGHSSRDSTNKGNVYRAWMHVKSAFSGQDRHGILDSCEHNEAEAQEAYRLALTRSADLDGSVRSLIQEQKASLEIAHVLIKNFKRSALSVVA